MFDYNYIRKKKSEKNYCSSNEAIKVFGFSDFGRSVKKGKQTVFFKI
jgi:hypothetical protein